VQADTSGAGITYVYAFARVEYCVSGFVTVTLFKPAEFAGAVTDTADELTKVTPVAGSPPIDTVHPLTKFVPFTVTACPPSVVPEDGVHDVTEGGMNGEYVNMPVPVADCVSRFVTVTLTAPAACAGVFILRVVEFTYVTAAALPPIVTVQPLSKFEPVMVTDWPPPV
jgi:hypothetical protein